MSALQIAAKLNAEGVPAAEAGTGLRAGDGPDVNVALGVGSDKEALGALGPGEWWLADLGRELRIDGHKLRTWIARGWVHARRSPAQGLWIAWADPEELARLGQLRDRSRMGAKNYPTGLTAPGPRG